LIKLKKINDFIWEIPKKYKKEMLVPARIFSSDKLINTLDEHVIEQITNVATLPGIQKYAFAMPDAHSGYGFPIGGVAAMDAESGVISPGGIGFDINCGMRLVITNLTINDVKPKLKELVDELFKRVPAGVGGSGFIKLNQNEFKEMTELGSKWFVEKGYGWKCRKNKSNVNKERCETNWHTWIRKSLFRNTGCEKKQHIRQ